MKVRYPRLDFSKVRPHWAPHLEFAQSRNAASTIPPYVEPYLIKVMQQAKAQLDPAERKLHADIELFIKQESQHYRLHNSFNRRLREHGYPGLAALEKALADDLQSFLQSRSLEFNCAYADGFEAMGAVGAQLFFEELDDFLAGADPESVDLWKWHLAEEFEHRHVCYEIHKKLFGAGLRGYFSRVHGFLFAFFHLSRYSSGVMRYLLAEDRKRMPPEEVRRSKAREKDYQRKMLGRAVPRLFAVLSPFYDPSRKRTPRGLNEYLLRYEQPPRDGV